MNGARPAGDTGGDTGGDNPADDVRIDVVAIDDVGPDLDADLTAIVAEVFPDVAELRGQWFFQSRPDVVTVARVGHHVVGLRPVARRMIDVGGEAVAVAGGIIPTVLPAWRGRGIARRMTEITLDWITQCGDGLSLAFLFDGAPAAFLTPFGYEALPCRFVYTDVDSNADIVEDMRAFGRALGTPPRVDLKRVQRTPEIHLGRGTW